MSQRRLARELGVADSEVRRMLNPNHATKTATIDRTLRRLGKRVTVTVGEAGLIRCCSEGPDQLRGGDKLCAVR